MSAFPMQLDNEGSTLSTGTDEVLTRVKWCHTNVNTSKRMNCLIRGHGRFGKRCLCGRIQHWGHFVFIA